MSYSNGYINRFGYTQLNYQCNGCGGTFHFMVENTILTPRNFEFQSFNRCSSCGYDNTTNLYKVLRNHNEKYQNSSMNIPSSSKSNLKQPVYTEDTNYLNKVEAKKEQLNTKLLLL